jgi:hypothetical protein
MGRQTTEQLSVLTDQDVVGIEVAEDLEATQPGGGEMKVVYRGRPGGPEDKLIPPFKRQIRCAIRNRNLKAASSVEPSSLPRRGFQKGDRVGVPVKRPR